MIKPKKNTEFLMSFGHSLHAGYSLAAAVQRAQSNGPLLQGVSVSQHRNDVGGYPQDLGKLHVKASRTCGVKCHNMASTVMFYPTWADAFFSIEALVTWWNPQTCTKMMENSPETWWKFGCVSKQGTQRSTVYPLYMHCLLLIFPYGGFLKWGYPQSSS